MDKSVVGKKKVGKKMKHPYVVKVEGICGGRPIIDGTRTPVRSIVGYYKMGMSVEEILEDLPHLTPTQVFDALSYYYDHQEEIEKDIEENMRAARETEDVGGNKTIPR